MYSDETPIRFRIDVLPIPLAPWATCRFERLLGFFALVGLAFGFPVAGLRLAVPLKFHLALDRVAAELPVVFLSHLVSLELAGDLEGYFLTFDLGLSYGGFSTAAGNGSGQLVAIELLASDRGKRSIQISHGGRLARFNAECSRAAGNRRARFHSSSQAAVSVRRWRFSLSWFPTFDRIRAIDRAASEYSCNLFPKDRLFHIHNVIEDAPGYIQSSTRLPRGTTKARTR